MTEASILWHRLDTPGHDASRLLRSGAGWRLDGTAVFLQEGSVAALDYRVECDSQWRTTSGRIAGWWGDQSVDTTIVRQHDGSWRINGRPETAVEGCVDLDFGFTPATNLFQLRRLDLQVGEMRTLRVAWLDLPALRLELLEQSYTRRSDSTYWYESARFAYAALLEVGSHGFTHLYPGLWRSVRP